jgi:hypothetical protein
LRLALVLCLAALPARAQEATATATVEAAKPSKGPGLTGGLRTGLYVDGDRTTVFRALAAMAGSLGRWSLSGNVAVDVVSSSSVDVRSSPLGKVDVVTTASGGTQTSGGTMTDRRLAATLGAGWNSGRGHTFGLSASYANERDYNSVGGGVNASLDFLGRLTTVLGGVSFTQNWIASMIDPAFAQRMWDVGWSLGVAQVLGRRDALRLRYDGAVADGYQASPYRNVRFGDWTPVIGDHERIMFVGTIGSPDGLPEKEPDIRVRHALVLEWVHSFTEKLGLFSQARLGTDSWGVDNLSVAAELRAATTWWRLRLGYRFYAQSSADFYHAKYVQSPDKYAYYTSDKELATEYGHIVNLGISRVLMQPKREGDARMLLDLGVHVLYYSYPGFLLLPSRTSGFLDVGLTWEL